MPKEEFYDTKEKIVDNNKIYPRITDLKAHIEGAKRDLDRNGALINDFAKDRNLFKD